MSDEQQHTPGPWRIGYWSGRCRKPEHEGRHPGPPQCVYEPEFNEGSEQFIGGIAGSGVNVMVVDTSYDELVIKMADARLITAAPELLDALKYARSVIQGHAEDHCDGCKQTLDMLDATIAKAEGRKP